LAAYTMHARGGTSTEAGTAAFLSRFEREVDPEGVLSPEVRAKRAEQARKAYMTRLAFESVKARRAKKAA
jgi:hypothetical protein